ncbi:hypothetical protein BJP25_11830 [Actinokineospora bangkokensis]|uniref:Smf/DprA SLOG domain-containing protein n=1 Tax=Actinokineospora bangkokensis TaxID=1193682 RepID=A0A1Q9LQX9_9PSEU|nr:hypothetical protein BJP25_11830 [Actinokineospora bangkokensis]
MRRLLSSGRSSLLEMIERLPDADRERAAETADRLAANGIGALLCDDPRFPDRLRRFPGAPPVLFYRGAVELLHTAAVGVCGSREVSADGVRAARACAEEAARLKITVVSGNARGVDAASHVAALEAGGSTIAVLPEGIDNAKVKESNRELYAGAADRLLVISQFPPAQRWTAGAAMARNHVVVGLSDLVVVVEAGETGGTAKAGDLALRAERPLVVLRNPKVAIPGNQRLIAAGAREVVDREQLRSRLRQLSSAEDSQLQLD